MDPREAGGGSARPHVDVVVDKQVFRIEREMLTKYSPFFKRTFEKDENRKKNKLKLSGISAATFKILLQYMRTGQLIVAPENVADVFSAAFRLHMSDVVKKCIQLETETTPMGQQMLMYSAARRLNLEDEERRSFDFLTSHFMSVVTTKEFLEMEMEDVMQLMSAESIGCRREMEIFEAGMRWLNYAPEQRYKQGEALMSVVHFDNMNVQELHQCLEYPGISDMLSVRKKVIAAICNRSTNNDKEISLRPPRTYKLLEEQLVSKQPNSPIDVSVAKIEKKEEQSTSTTAVQESLDPTSTTCTSDRPLLGRAHRKGGACLVVKDPPEEVHATGKQFRDNKNDAYRDQSFIAGSHSRFYYDDFQFARPRQTTYTKVQGMPGSFIEEETQGVRRMQALLEEVRVVRRVKKAKSKHGPEGQTLEVEISHNTQEKKPIPLPAPVLDAPVPAKRLSVKTPGVTPLPRKTTLESTQGLGMKGLCDYGETKTPEPGSMSSGRSVEDIPYREEHTSAPTSTGAPSVASAVRNRPSSVSIGELSALSERSEPAGARTVFSGSSVSMYSLSVNEQKHPKEVQDLVSSCTSDRRKLQGDDVSAFDSKCSEVSFPAIFSGDSSEMSDYKTGGSELKSETKILDTFGISSSLSPASNGERTKDYEFCHTATENTSLCSPREARRTIQTSLPFLEVVETTERGFETPGAVSTTDIIEGISVSPQERLVAMSGDSYPPDSAPNHTPLTTDHPRETAKHYWVNPPLFTDYKPESFAETLDTSQREVCVLVSHITPVGSYEAVAGQRSSHDVPDSIIGSNVSQGTSASYEANSIPTENWSEEPDYEGQEKDSPRQRREDVGVKMRVRCDASGMGVGHSRREDASGSVPYLAHDSYSSSEGQEDKAVQEVLSRDKFATPRGTLSFELPSNELVDHNADHVAIKTQVLPEASSLSEARPKHPADRQREALTHDGTTSEDKAVVDVDEGGSVVFSKDSEKHCDEDTVGQGTTAVSEHDFRVSEEVSRDATVKDEGSQKRSAQTGGPAHVASIGSGTSREMLSYDPHNSTEAESYDILGGTGASANVHTPRETGQSTELVSLGTADDKDLMSDVQPRKAAKHKTPKHRGLYEVTPSTAHQTSNLSEQHTVGERTRHETTEPVEWYETTKSPTSTGKHGAVNDMVPNTSTRTESNGLVEHTEHSTLKPVEEYEAAEHAVQESPKPREVKESAVHGEAQKPVEKKLAELSHSPTEENGAATYVERDTRQLTKRKEPTLRALHDPMEVAVRDLARPTTTAREQHMEYKPSEVMDRYRLTDHAVHDLSSLFEQEIVHHAGYETFVLVEKPFRITELECAQRTVHEVPQPINEDSVTGYTIKDQRDTIEAIPVPETAHGHMAVQKKREQERYLIAELKDTAPQDQSGTTEVKHNNNDDEEAVFRHIVVESSEVVSNIAVHSRELFQSSMFKAPTDVTATAVLLETEAPTFEAPEGTNIQESNVDVSYRDSALSEATSVGLLYQQLVSLLQNDVTVAHEEVRPLETPLPAGRKNSDSVFSSDAELPSGSSTVRTVSSSALPKDDDVLSDMSDGSSPLPSHLFEDHRIDRSGEVIVQTASVLDYRMQSPYGSLATDERITAGGNIEVHETRSAEFAPSQVNKDAESFEANDGQVADGSATADNTGETVKDIDSSAAIQDTKSASKHFVSAEFSQDQPTDHAPGCPSGPYFKHKTKIVAMTPTHSVELVEESFTRERLQTTIAEEAEVRRENMEKPTQNVPDAPEPTGLGNAGNDSDAKNNDEEKALRKESTVKGKNAGPSKKTDCKSPVFSRTRIYAGSSSHKLELVNEKTAIGDKELRALHDESGMPPSTSATGKQDSHCCCGAQSTTQSKTDCQGSPSRSNYGGKALPEGLSKANGQAPPSKCGPKVQTEGVSRRVEQVIKKISDVEMHRKNLQRACSKEKNKAKLTVMKQDIERLKTHESSLHEVLKALAPSMAPPTILSESDEISSTGNTKDTTRVSFEGRVVPYDDTHDLPVPVKVDQDNNKTCNRLPENVKDDKVVCSSGSTPVTSKRDNRMASSPMKKATVRYIDENATVAPKEKKATKGASCVCKPSTSERDKGDPVSMQDNKVKSSSPVRRALLSKIGVPSPHHLCSRNEGFTSACRPLKKHQTCTDEMATDDDKGMDEETKHTSSTRKSIRIGPGREPHTVGEVLQDAKRDEASLRKTDDSEAVEDLSLSYDDAANNNTLSSNETTTGPNVNADSANNNLSAAVKRETPRYPCQCKVPDLGKKSGDIKSGNTTRFQRPKATSPLALTTAETSGVLSLDAIPERSCADSENADDRMETFRMAHSVPIQEPTVADVSVVDSESDVDDDNIAKPQPQKLGASKVGAATDTTATIVPAVHARAGGHMNYHPSLSFVRRTVVEESVTTCRRATRRNAKSVINRQTGLEEKDSNTDTTVTREDRKTRREETIESYDPNADISQFSSSPLCTSPFNTLGLYIPSASSPPYHTESFAMSPAQNGSSPKSPGKKAVAIRVIDQFSSEAAKVTSDPLRSPVEPLSILKPQTTGNVEFQIPLQEDEDDDDEEASFEPPASIMARLGRKDSIAVAKIRKMKQDGDGEEEAEEEEAEDEAVEEGDEQDTDDAEPLSKKDSHPQTEGEEMDDVNEGPEKDKESAGPTATVHPPSEPVEGTVLVSIREVSLQILHDAFHTEKGTENGALQQRFSVDHTVVERHGELTTLQTGKGSSESRQPFDDKYREGPRDMDEVQDNTRKERSEPGGGLGRGPEAQHLLDKSGGSGAVEQSKVLIQNGETPVCDAGREQGTQPCTDEVSKRDAVRESESETSRNGGVTTRNAYQAREVEDDTEIASGGRDVHEEPRGGTIRHEESKAATRGSVEKSPDWLLKQRGESTLPFTETYDREVPQQTAYLKSESEADAAGKRYGEHYLKREGSPRGVSKAATPVAEGQISSRETYAKQEVTARTAYLVSDTGTDIEGGLETKRDETSSGSTTDSGKGAKVKSIEEQPLPEDATYREASTRSASAAPQRESDLTEQALSTNMRTLNGSVVERGVGGSAHLTAAEDAAGSHHADVATGHIRTVQEHSEYYSVVPDGQVIADKITQQGQHEHSSVALEARAKEIHDVEAKRHYDPGDEEPLLTGVVGKKQAPWTGDTNTLGSDFVPSSLRPETQTPSLSAQSYTHRAGSSLRSSQELYTTAVTASASGAADYVDSSVPNKSHEHFADESHLTAKYVSEELEDISEQEHQMARMVPICECEKALQREQEKRGTGTKEYETKYAEEYAAQKARHGIQVDETEHNGSISEAAGSRETPKQEPNQETARDVDIATVDHRVVEHIKMIGSGAVSAVQMDVLPESPAMLHKEESSVYDNTQLRSTLPYLEIEEIGSEGSEDVAPEGNFETAQAVRGTEELLASSVRRAVTGVDADAELLMGKGCLNCIEEQTLSPLIDAEHAIVEYIESVTARTVPSLPSSSPVPEPTPSLNTKETAAGNAQILAKDTVVSRRKFSDESRLESHVVATVVATAGVEEDRTQSTEQRKETSRDVVYHAVDAEEPLETDGGDLTSMPYKKELEPFNKTTVTKTTSVVEKPAADQGWRRADVVQHDLAEVTSSTAAEVVPPIITGVAAPHTASDIGSVSTVLVPLQPQNTQVREHERAQQGATEGRRLEPRKELTIDLLLGGVGSPTRMQDTKLQTVLTAPVEVTVRPIISEKKRRKSATIIIEDRHLFGLVQQGSVVNSLAEAEIETVCDAQSLSQALIETPDHQHGSNELVERFASNVVLRGQSEVESIANVTRDILAGLTEEAQDSRPLITRDASEQRQVIAVTGTPQTEAGKLKNQIVLKEQHVLGKIEMPAALVPFQDMEGETTDALRAVSLSHGQFLQETSSKMSSFGIDEKELKKLESLEDVTIAVPLQSEAHDDVPKALVDTSERLADGLQSGMLEEVDSRCTDMESATLKDETMKMSKRTSPSSISGTESAVGEFPVSPQHVPPEGGKPIECHVVSAKEVSDRLTVGKLEDVSQFEEVNMIQPSSVPDSPVSLGRALSGETGVEVKFESPERRAGTSMSGKRKKGSGPPRKKRTAQDDLVGVLPAHLKLKALEIKLVEGLMTASKALLSVKKALVSEAGKGTGPQLREEPSPVTARLFREEPLDSAAMAYTTEEQHTSGFLAPKYPLQPPQEVYDEGEELTTEGGEKRQGHTEKPTEPEVDPFEEARFRLHRQFDTSHLDVEMSKGPHWPKTTTDKEIDIGPATTEGLRITKAQEDHAIMDKQPTSTSVQPKADSASQPDARTEELGVQEVDSAGTEPQQTQSSANQSGRERITKEELEEYLKAAKKMQLRRGSAMPPSGKSPPGGGKKAKEKPNVVMEAKIELYGKGRVTFTFDAVADGTEEAERESMVDITDRMPLGPATTPRPSIVDMGERSATRQASELSKRSVDFGSQMKDQSVLYEPSEPPSTVGHVPGQEAEPERKPQVFAEGIEPQLPVTAFRYETEEKSQLPVTPSERTLITDKDSIRKHESTTGGIFTAVQTPVGAQTPLSKAPVQARTTGGLFTLVQTPAGGMTPIPIPPVQTRTTGGLFTAAQTPVGGRTPLPKTPAMARTTGGLFTAAQTPLGGITPLPRTPALPRTTAGLYTAAETPSEGTSPQQRTLMPALTPSSFLSGVPTPDVQSASYPSEVSPVPEAAMAAVAGSKSSLESPASRETSPPQETPAAQMKANEEMLSHESAATPTEGSIDTTEQIASQKKIVPEITKEEGASSIVLEYPTSESFGKPRDVSSFRETTPATSLQTFGTEEKKVLETITKDAETKLERTAPEAPAQLLAPFTGVTEEAETKTLVSTSSVEVSTDMKLVSDTHEEVLSAVSVSPEEVKVAHADVTDERKAGTPVTVSSIDEKVSADTVQETVDASSRTLRDLESVTHEVEEAYSTVSLLQEDMGVLSRGSVEMGTTETAASISTVDEKVSHISQEIVNASSKTLRELESIACEIEDLFSALSITQEEMGALSGSTIEKPVTETPVSVPAVAEKVSVVTQENVDASSRTLREIDSVTHEVEDVSSAVSISPEEMGAQSIGSAGRVVTHTSVSVSSIDEKTSADSTQGTVNASSRTIKELESTTHEIEEVYSEVYIFPEELEAPSTSAREYLVTQMPVSVSTVEKISADADQETVEASSRALWELEGFEHEQEEVLLDISKLSYELEAPPTGIKEPTAAGTASVEEGMLSEYVAQEISGDASNTLGRLESSTRELEDILHWISGLKEHAASILGPPEERAKMTTAGGSTETHKQPDLGTVITSGAAVKVVTEALSKPDELGTVQEMTSRVLTPAEADVFSFERSEEEPESRPVSPEPTKAVTEFSVGSTLQLAEEQLPLEVELLEGGLSVELTRREALSEALCSENITEALRRLAEILSVTQDVAKAYSEALAGKKTFISPQDVGEFTSVGVPSNRDISQAFVPLSDTATQLAEPSEQRIVAGEANIGELTTPLPENVTEALRRLTEIVTATQEVAKAYAETVVLKKIALPVEPKTDVDTRIAAEAYDKIMDQSMMERASPVPLDATQLVAELRPDESPMVPTKISISQPETAVQVLEQTVLDTRMTEKVESVEPLELPATGVGASVLVPVGEAEEQGIVEMVTEALGRLVEVETSIQAVIKAYSEVSFLRDVSVVPVPADRTGLIDARAEVASAHLFREAALPKPVEVETKEIMQAVENVQLQDGFLGDLVALGVQEVLQVEQLVPTDIRDEHLVELPDKQLNAVEVSPTEVVPGLSGETVAPEGLTVESPGALERTPHGWDEGHRPEPEDVHPAEVRALWQIEQDVATRVGKYVVPEDLALSRDDHVSLLPTPPAFMRVVGEQDQETVATDVVVRALKDETSQHEAPDAAEGLVDDVQGAQGTLDLEMEISKGILKEALIVRDATTAREIHPELQHDEASAEEAEAPVDLETIPFNVSEMDWETELRQLRDNRLLSKGKEPRKTKPSIAEEEAIGVPVEISSTVDKQEPLTILRELDVVKTVSGGYEIVVTCEREVKRLSPDSAPFILTGQLPSSTASRSTQKRNLALPDKALDDTQLSASKKLKDIEESESSSKTPKGKAFEEAERESPVRKEHHISGSKVERLRRRTSVPKRISLFRPPPDIVEEMTVDTTDVAPHEKGKDSSGDVDSESVVQKEEATQDDLLLLPDSEKCSREPPKETPLRRKRTSLPTSDAGVTDMTGRDLKILTEGSPDQSGHWLMEGPPECYRMPEPRPRGVLDTSRRSITRGGTIEREQPYKEQIGKEECQSPDGSVQVSGDTANESSYPAEAQASLEPREIQKREISLRQTYAEKQEPLSQRMILEHDGDTKISNRREAHSLPAEEELLPRTLCDLTETAVAHQELLSQEAQDHRSVNTADEEKLMESAIVEDRPTLPQVVLKRDVVANLLDKNVTETCAPAETLGGDRRVVVLTEETTVPVEEEKSEVVVLWSRGETVAIQEAEAVEIPAEQEMLPNRIGVDNRNHHYADGFHAHSGGLIPYARQHKRNAEASRKKGTVVRALMPLPKVRARPPRSLIEKANQDVSGSIKDLTEISSGMIETLYDVGLCEAKRASVEVIPENLVIMEQPQSRNVSSGREDIPHVSRTIISATHVPDVCNWKQDVAERFTEGLSAERKPFPRTLSKKGTKQESEVVIISTGVKNTKHQNIERIHADDVGLTSLGVPAVREPLSRRVIEREDYVATARRSTAMRSDTSHGITEKMRGETRNQGKVEAAFGKQTSVQVASSSEPVPFERKRKCAAFSEAKRRTSLQTALCPCYADEAVVLVTQPIAERVPYVNAALYTALDDGHVKEKEDQDPVRGTRAMVSPHEVGSSLEHRKDKRKHAELDRGLRSSASRGLPLFSVEKIASHSLLSIEPEDQRRQKRRVKRPPSHDNMHAQMGANFTTACADPLLRRPRTENREPELCASFSLMSTEFAMSSKDVRDASTYTLESDTEDDQEAQDEYLPLYLHRVTLNDKPSIAEMIRKLTPCSEEREEAVPSNWKLNPAKGMEKWPSPCVQDVRSTTIFLMGGINLAALDQVLTGCVMLRYNVEEGEWRRCSMMPLPRYGHRCVYLMGEIYVIGGFDNRDAMYGLRMSTSFCFRYNAQTGEWSATAPLRYARGYHGVTVLDNRIFAVGGVDANDLLLSNVECYDPEEDTWTVLQKGLYCGRMGMGVTAFQNKLWVVGGIVQIAGLQTCSTAYVEIYNPVTQQWTYAASYLPSPRTCVSLLNVDDRALYCFGGIYYNCVGPSRKLITIEDILLYNDANKVWKQVDYLPSPRHNAHILQYRNQTFVVGGQDVERPDDPVHSVLTMETSSGKFHWKRLKDVPLPISSYGAVIIPPLEQAAQRTPR
ncbi:uncharacterized protein LOC135394745 isoform X3 [Ornithodoros turicata]|uniref:uncharacterized protein LOC135394745 isoform X3 n=1 Tax=Ornithodoros turicata TaxID=34597 RepID=UPI003138C739